MKDTFINARLIAPNQIRLGIFSSLPLQRFEARLQIDYSAYLKLPLTRSSSMGEVAILDYRLDHDLELGHSYHLILPTYGTVALDVSDATSFPGFDTRYLYSGPLGAVYSPSETSFYLWTPLASSVLLKYRKKDGDPWIITEMKRGEYGDYSLTLRGDYEGFLYRYVVVNSENPTETTDPYAKASTANGGNSVVVDFAKLQVDFHREALPVLNSPVDAIIYEGHVRDLTIDSHSDIVHKGKFAGLMEPGRKSEKGHPAGFDYLKSLGITHLQLLPLYDYETVDELHPDKSYNWGYDPAQYFVPEGSYATDPKDPTCRIKELKALVSAYHAAGIRIVMDVVYNHVYDYARSVFEKCVPNYYFRRRPSGRIANTSGCGDDFATEKPMARRLILDACRHWIVEYGIDGFRFDLMGIMDVTTCNQVADMAKKIDPSFILYGEGWDMGGEVGVPLAHMGNAAKLPRFAFFNDQYRDSLKRYLVGDEEAMQVFKSSFVSSSIDFIVPKRFSDATQTINYVECHDNETFYDFVASRQPEWSLSDRLDIVKLANQLVLLSFGIPFIHMGQEIAQSKWGDGNTYNKGDHYNKFSYRLLDERFAMVEDFKKAVAFRKTRAFLHVYDPRVIDQLVELSDMGSIMHVDFADGNLIAPATELDLFVNPTSNDEQYDESVPHRVLLGGAANLDPNKKSRSILIPKRSLTLSSDE